MANHIKRGSKVIWHHGDPCQVIHGTLEQYHVDHNTVMTGAGLVFGAGLQVIVRDVNGMTCHLPPKAIRKSTPSNRLKMTQRANEINKSRAERRKANGK